MYHISESCYYKVEDTNCNFKEVELNPISFDDMPKEEHNAIILKSCQDKIDNEIFPKYADRAIATEVIEEVNADVSKIFNELRSVISSRMVTILKSSL